MELLTICGATFAVGFVFGMAVFALFLVAVEAESKRRR